MIPILENKTKTVRHLGRVDISSIKSKILQIPEAIWNMETKKRENNFSVFTQTEHIVFRFNRNLHDHTSFFDKPLWEIWKPHLQPIMKEAVTIYNYENGIVPKAMLAKLKAGGVIDRHIDSGPRNRQIHKIHIPIQTSSEVLFYIEDEAFEMKEGHAYEVNNIVRHKAENHSSIDRIHLIFEYYNEPK